MTTLPASSVPTTRSQAKKPTSIRFRAALVLYLVACAIGITLRLLYPADTGWFNDQKWDFAHGSQMGVTEPWDWLGPESSGGVRNAGMSIWVFVGLIRVFHLTTPQALSRAIAYITILALVLIGLWASRLPDTDKTDWLCAGALAAVNPTEIWLSRVIWCQGIITLLLVVFWIGVWNRKRWWGALLWGAVSASLGQLHMAGFFTAVTVFLWIVIFRRQGVRWGTFVVGTLLTGWPLVPWIRYVLSGNYQRVVWPLSAHPPGKVWAWWLLANSGLATKYEAFNFWRSPFLPFLKAPVVFGHPTYLMLAAHGAVALLLVFALYTSGRHLRQWKQTWKVKLFCGDTETGLFLRASVIGFAGLLTLLPAPVFVHYFQTIFPMGYVWLTRMLRSRPPEAGSVRLVIAMAILQLAISLTAAVYVHQHFGAAAGTFGIRVAAITNWQPEH
jgi:hypothetical protein